MGWKKKKYLHVILIVRFIVRTNCKIEHMADSQVGQRGQLKSLVILITMLMTVAH